MSIQSLVIILSMIIVLGLWVSAPLTRGRGLSRNHVGADSRKRERLLVHYERLLTNLRDLDEDYATGKVIADAYHADRERLVQAGIQMLKLMDQLSVSPAAEDSADLDASVDRQIEAAVATQRRRSGPEAIR